MPEDRRVNVTFNGKVVGWARVAADNLVGEIELEETDLEYVNPNGGDLTEGLSMAFKGEEPDWDTEAAEAMADLEALYNKYRPKGTFDA